MSSDELCSIHQSSYMSVCLLLLAGQSVPCVGPFGPHTVSVPLTVGGVSQQQSLTAHGTPAVSGCCGNLSIHMMVPALVDIKATADSSV